MSVVVRAAKTSDIKKIRKIVDSFAEQRRLLSKETVTLYEGVQEFTIAEVDGEIVGCGALHVLWEDLAEVRTVAVVESMHGKGIGHAILENILNRAKEIGHEELVIIRDIEVFSHCEHHLTPFHGVAHVGYIPRGKITGLSKVARLVDLFARRPQVQERLTTQIADAMVKILDPMGVIVIIDCEHLCMSMRGVRKSQARTTTSAVRGVLRDPATRAEAISLITKS